MKKKPANALLGAVLAACAGLATAAYGPLLSYTCDAMDCRSFTFDGINAEDGSSLNALAVFEIVGSELVITLANTNEDEVLRNSDILTALYFNYTGGTTLASLLTLGSTANMAGTVGNSNSDGGDAPDAFQSLTLYAGGNTTCEGVIDIVNDGDGDTLGCGDQNVGGEWAFNGDITGGFNGFSMGISSAGLPGFGNPTFGTDNLAGPLSVDGGQYGLASAFPDGGGVGANVSYDPLTQNAVQFTFNLTPEQQSALDLSSTRGFLSAAVQYGTSPGGPFIPIPGTLALLALGLVGLGWVRRRNPA
jgi:hypothetical protein